MNEEINSNERKKSFVRRHIFTASFFLITFFGGSVFTYVFHLYNSNLLKEMLFNNLNVVARIESEHVISDLNNRKDSAVVISESRNIKEFLQNPKNIDLQDGIKQQLEGIKNDHVFDEILLLNSGGSILIYTQEGITDADIFKGFDFSGEKPGQAYIHPLRYCDCDNKYFLDITAPVAAPDGNIAGFVAARISINNLKDFFGGKLNEFGDHGQTYVVNSDELLITPSVFLKGDNKGVMTQKVDSQNVKNCFSKTPVDKNVSFLDFRGEEVLGSSVYIPETDWCLLAEVDNSEAIIAPEINTLKTIIPMVLGVVALCTLVGVVVDKFFKINR